MKCNLITQINEVTIKDYSLIEDEGILAALSNYSALSYVYEDDEEKPGKYIIVIKGRTMDDLFKFF